MNVEDKYLNEGVINNVKNAISDIAIYMKDIKKFYPQLKQIADFADKEEFEKASKLCQDVRLKTNSAILADLIHSWEQQIKAITEIQGK